VFDGVEDVAIELTEESFGCAEELGIMFAGDGFDFDASGGLGVEFGAELEADDFDGVAELAQDLAEEKGPHGTAAGKVAYDQGNFRGLGQVSHGFLGRVGVSCQIN
jgi:hypothetical protein